MGPRVSVCLFLLFSSIPVIRSNKNSNSITLSYTINCVHLNFQQLGNQSIKHTVADACKVRSCLSCVCVQRERESEVGTDLVLGVINAPLFEVKWGPRCVFWRVLTGNR